MGRYRAKGVITVFFSLTSVLILSLICTTLESARVQGARAQAANIADMGNYSVFGEYEKKLLEKYEIFAVDGSYGTGDFSIERVNGRLRSYLQKNAAVAENGLVGLCFDPWNLKLDDSKIQEYALLSDQGGEVFYQQAVAYMKKTIVAAGIGKLFQYHHDAVTAKSKQEEYQRNKDSSDQDMKELEKQENEKKKALEEQKETGDTAGAKQTEEMVPSENVSNPLKMIKKLIRKSILELVCPEADISDKKVSGKELSSKRSNKKGNMKLESKYSGLTSDLLFREYLLDHFPNYLSKEKEGKLDYQIEYLIGGKKSDKDNLKSVVRQLLLLREGMNYMYCVRDSEMSAATESLAALLIGWTGIPPLVTVMKHALLLGWAYGESLMDVRILLSGGKVPLMKSPESWVVTLDNLGRLDELLENAGDSHKEGSSYLDYLRILLNLQSVSDQTKRSLDMVELNLQSIAGLSNFRVDHCVVGIREKTEWTIKPIFLRVSTAFLGTSQSDICVTADSGFAYH